MVSSHLGCTSPIELDGRSSALPIPSLRSLARPDDVPAILSREGNMRSTRNAVIVQVPTALMAAFVGVLCACADSPTSPNAVKTAFRPLAAVLPATRTEFEGFIHFCGGTDPTKINVTPGDILHFKEGTHENVRAT